MCVKISVCPLCRTCVWLRATLYCLCNFMFLKPARQHQLQMLTTWNCLQTMSELYQQSIRVQQAQSTKLQTTLPMAMTPMALKVNLLHMLLKMPARMMSALASMVRMVVLSLTRTLTFCKRLSMKSTLRLQPNHMVEQIVVCTHGHSAAKQEWQSF